MKLSSRGYYILTDKPYRDNEENLNQINAAVKRMSIR
jgi:hypothetical protein